jgi:CubicO group peptidase (beta-lactamase class C family)
MRHVIPAFFLLWVSACGDDRGTFRSDEIPGLPASLTTAPENTGDGWTTSTPAAEGIDTATLQTALEAIRDGRYPRVDALVVIRHGKLVAEGYYGGYGRETLHDLRSTGKSFTSALTGIAVEQGLLQVDQPISQLIPRFEEYRHMDDRKRAITVRHLLNMSAGLDCNDWDPGSPGNEERMYGKSDWVRFILDLPATRDPGLISSYCTGGVVVLGHIISQRSGMELDQFAETYLFTQLGIRSSEWRRSPDGAATGGGGLKLRPRDAAKLGQLYLDGGRWNGGRILSAAWTDESRRAPTALGRDGYGFLWWKRAFRHRTTPVDAFFTSGNGGNFIIVIPSLDLVVVLTGSNYNQATPEQPLMEIQVLPAVQ